jgi:hypothetical protein
VILLVSPDTVVADKFRVTFLITGFCVATLLDAVSNCCPLRAMTDNWAVCLRRRRDGETSMERPGRVGGHLFVGLLIGLCGRHTQLVVVWDTRTAGIGPRGGEIELGGVTIRNYDLL